MKIKIIKNMYYNLNKQKSIIFADTQKKKYKYFLLTKNFLT